MVADGVLVHWLRYSNVLLPYYGLCTRIIIDTLQDGWPQQVLTMQRNVALLVWKLLSHLPIPKFMLNCLYNTCWHAYGRDICSAEHPLALKAAENNPELALKNAAWVQLQKLTWQQPRHGNRLVCKTPCNWWTASFANYVLMSYGSGAVMAVPTNVTLNLRISSAYQLSKCQRRWRCRLLCNWVARMVQEGKLVNSGEFDGLEFQATHSLRN